MAEKMTLVEAEGLLTEKEVEALRARAAKTLFDEKKKRAEDVLYAEMLNDARREAGMLSGDEVKDEPVSITVDVAEYTYCVSVNGRQYVHGETYTVPRHVADTIREIMFRSHAHQTEVDGKDPFYALRQPRGTHLSGKYGVRNAPARPA